MDKKFVDKRMKRARARTQLVIFYSSSFSLSSSSRKPLFSFSIAATALRTASFSDDNKSLVLNVLLSPNTTFQYCCRNFCFSSSFITFLTRKFFFNGFNNLVVLGLLPFLYFLRISLYCSSNNGFKRAYI